MHGILEEEGWTLEAEVDQNIAQLEEQEADEFELPAATAPMPWETRPEVEDADDVEESSTYNEDSDEPYEAAIR